MSEPIMVMSDDSTLIAKSSWRRLFLLIFAVLCLVTVVLVKHFRPGPPSDDTPTVPGVKLVFNEHSGSVETGEHVVENPGVLPTLENPKHPENPSDETPQPNQEQETHRTFSVRENDCLWHIAGRPEVFGDPALWPRLYQANHQQIRDPNLIYPNQRILIPTE